MTARDLAATVRAQMETSDWTLEEITEAREALADLEQQLQQAERKAQDFGPFFFRDACRVFGLPENSDLDALMKRMKDVVQQLQQAQEARDYNAERGDKFKAAAKRLDGYEKDQRARAVRAEEALRQLLDGLSGAETTGMEMMAARHLAEDALAAAGADTA